MDVSERDFQTAVIERSRDVPVVVDFWAEWCGPCRQLGPLIERLVEARQGKVELAKVDVDANPGLARTYGIQGIPAVKAFRDGKLAAEFVGAQPPLAVERFLDSLIPSETVALIAAGDEASLRRAVELEPSNAQAVVPLARLLHARGQSDEALKRLAEVPGSFVGDGLAARIALERAGGKAQSTEGGGAPDLSAAFQALDDGDRERALDLLIEAISSADGARDEIRRVVVGVLDELGADDPLARDARRRLATALY